MYIHHSCECVIYSLQFTVLPVHASALIEGTGYCTLYCLCCPCVLAHVCTTTRYVLQIRKRNLSCFIIIYNPVYDWSCLQVYSVGHGTYRIDTTVMLCLHPLPPDHCLHHCVLTIDAANTTAWVNCLVRATNYLFLSCALNLSSSLVLSFKTYTHNQQTEENKAIHQFLSSFNFRSYDRTWWLFPPP